MSIGFDLVDEKQNADTDKWFYERHRGTVAFNMSKIRKLDQFPYMMGLFKMILYLITPY